MYTVHLRRAGLDPEHDIVLVKEGFCWPALFLSLLWALWHGLWLVALGLVLVEVALAWAVHLIGLDIFVEAVLSLVVYISFAFIANDLRRWALSRRGFLEVTVVGGRDTDSAEARLFERNPGLGEGFSS
ncbi:MAG: DUF2628 domain-containing protein [Rhodospirillales bacterium]|nr:DUF2628 domain-containing protein [Rhodospirillales bacterium]